MLCYVSRHTHSCGQRTKTNKWHYINIHERWVVKKLRVGPHYQPAWALFVQFTGHGDICSGVGTVGTGDTL